MSKSISIARLLGTVLIVACGCAAVVAQSTKDTFVIYAKAGHINQATGSARVRKAPGEAGRILTISDELAEGDVVTTDANTKLEVLLSPGSYFRVADNAEFEMLGTTFEDLRLRLNRGSAVIESGGSQEKTLRIQLETPSGPVVIIQAGIYRLNVAADRTELMVVKGQAAAGSALALVKSGQTVTLGKDEVGRIAKFAKKTSRDGLDMWSRDRAELLAKANRSLSHKDLSTFGRLGWAYDAQGFLPAFPGLWMFSRRCGYALFIPFDLSGWSSPYGFGYGSDILYGMGYGAAIYYGESRYTHTGPPGGGSNDGGTRGSSNSGGNGWGNGMTKSSSLPQAPTNGPVSPTGSMPQSPTKVQ